VRDERIPRILPASSRTSSGDRATLTRRLAASAGVDLRLDDPDVAPSARAASTASSTENAGIPRASHSELAKDLLPWYS